MVMKTPTWTHQLSATGNVGASITITPTQTDSMNVLFELDITAPNASESATVDVYADSVSAGNKLVATQQLLGISNGTLYLPKGGHCTTAWIVVVTGGSGSVYCRAKYR